MGNKINNIEKTVLFFESKLFMLGDLLKSPHVMAGNVSVRQVNTNANASDTGSLVPEKPIPKRLKPPKYKNDNIAKR